MAYKIQITIEGQTGAGTNYQVPLFVGQSSSSTGDDFHLDGLSTDFPAAKDDGGDFRFFAADETTPLDFWVESVSGSDPNQTALIWVKVSADLGTNQNIWLYFNGGEGNDSDGAATFPAFFDDFPGAALDTNKWDEMMSAGTGSIAVSSSVVTLTAQTNNGNRAIIQDSANYSFVGPGHAVRSLNNISQPTDGGQTFGFWETGNSNRAYFIGSFTGSVTSLSARSSGSTTTVTSNWTRGSYSVKEVCWRSGNIDFYDNGSAVSNSPVTTNVPSNTLGAAFQANVGTGGAAATVAADWVLIRKYQQVEPAFDSAGAIIPIGSFNAYPMMHQMLTSGGIM